MSIFDKIFKSKKENRKGSPNKGEEPISKAEKQYKAPLDSLDFQHAFYLCKSGKYDQAVAAYEKLIKISPKNITLPFNKGVALYRAKRYQDAIKEFDQVILQNEDIYEAWYGKALCLRGLYREPEIPEKFSDDPEKLGVLFVIANLVNELRNRGYKTNIKPDEDIIVLISNTPYRISIRGLLGKFMCWIFKGDGDKAIYPQDNYTNPTPEEQEIIKLARNAGVLKLAQMPIISERNAPPPFDKEKSGTTKGEKIETPLREESGEMPIGRWQIGDKMQNRYEIYDIKKGGMGEVYIVQDKEEQYFDEYFALKTFQDKYLFNEDVKERFKIEAETWVELGEHKNIVNAKHVGEIEDKPYIFLEYIEGEKNTLRRWIRPELDISKILDFSIQFCTGMDYAYNKLGVIHRDIKPENVMVTLDGVVKISDFGLVKSFGYQDSIRFMTREYASPEQIREPKNVDTRSDIYSFGVMLYEMLTGKLPFYGRTSKELMLKHLHENPKSLIEDNSLVSPELENIVLKCLEKLPKGRYKTFEGLKEDLLKAYLDFTGKEHSSGVIMEVIDLSGAELNSKGSSLSSIGKYEEAIECFNEALKIHPEIDKFWSNKGHALGEIGKLDEALKCFDSALEINSKNALTWGNKGSIFHKMGQFDKAIECFNKALELDLRLEGAWYNKGESFEKLGKYDEALECYNKGLGLSPKFHTTWNSKGLCLAKLDRFGEAIKCFTKAIELNPQSTDAWYNKGFYLPYLSKSIPKTDKKELRVLLDETIKCFEMVLRIDPNDQDAKKGITICKQKRKLLDE